MSTPKMNNTFEYEYYVYQGFSFEHPIYLYIWEILVTLSCLVNLVVVSVLLRKRMRNSTNMILVAIAVSDSMTGLVTLPSYIAVYQNFVPAKDYSDDNNTYSMPSTNVPSTTTTNGSTRYDIYPDYSGDVDNGTEYKHASYNIDRHLCEYFMISKFFVSKMFHTISIWFTLLLCIQRSVSSIFPYKSDTWFSKRHTVIVSGIILICSPLLHIYQLLDKKTNDGFCEWTLLDTDIGGIAYIWINFIFAHFVPCVSLTVFTVIFIVSLHKASSNITKSAGGQHISFRKRFIENRRITIVVTVVVCICLLTEVPYSVFLLYSAILKLTKRDLLDLKKARSVHVIYELSLIISFNANCLIYTMFNRKFRSTLKLTLLSPIVRLTGRRQPRDSVSWIGSISRNTHKINLVSK